MFGFIKSFFGGILSFFGKVLGLNKNKSESGKAGAAKPRKSSGYYMEADDSPIWETDNGSKATTTTPAPKPEPVKAAAPAEAAPAPAKVEPAPKPEPAKPVVAAAPVAAKVKAEPKQEKISAPSYSPSLINTNGRRRPGANMNYFLDMARKVKPSS